MIRVARAGGNGDRVACPWLINTSSTPRARTLYKTAEGEGLRAIAHAFADLTTDDHQKLD